MATKDKKPATKKETTVSSIIRIKADESEKPRQKEAKAAPQSTDKQTRSKNPFVAMGGYFAGAWYELKQVRWPNRKATWSMTAAVFAFTAFFVVLVLVLDALFKYLFDIILG